MTAQAERGLSEQAPQLASSLFQVSTLDALSLGLYQGVYSIGALKQQGDFGVGTFEGIDGEMTILNGHFYHFRSNGIVTEEPDPSRVPFAVITWFRPQVRFSGKGLSMDELSQQIDQHIRSTNLFYAVRIHGNFSELTTRAIPKLFPPYPPLSQAIEKEVQFPLQNINGTLVAFRCPAWVKGINQVGYHYHFISDDQTIGGHALSFTTGDVTVELQELQRNSIWVPDKGPFLTAPLPVTQ
ncbi:MAG: acetolactate decarboxylase [Acidobacteriaceae bacterium]|nr:acetolactate decarboxylase [Acidobacteriaceae bacterium]